MNKNITFQNIGNTCYLNSTLQCILSLDIFIDELMERKTLIHFSNNEDNDENNSMTIFLIKQINDIKNITNNNNSNSLIPFEFKKGLGQINKNFNNDKQHDVLDLTMTILQNIHEECKNHGKMILSKIDDNIIREILEEYQNSNEKKEIYIKLMEQIEEIKKENYIKYLSYKSLLYWINFIHNDYSIISKNFNILQCSETICKKCKNMTCTFEGELILSLSIDSFINKENTTIDDCITKYIEKENLEEYKCEKCNEKSINKKLNICTTSNILIIHLKRFLNKENKLFKLNNKISHPIFKYLDLTDYILNSRKSYKYELISFIIHKGSETGAGHYISYKKINNYWCEFNDNIITQNIPNEIIFKLSQEGYLFFYKKIS